MTHIIHPYAHRLGIIRTWKSRWFGANKKAYRDNLRIDTMLRKYLKKRLRGLYVASVEIERNSKELRIILKTSRPGMVIGRGGEGSVKLTQDIQDQLRKLKAPQNLEVKIDVVELKSPESHAAIIAFSIIEGLEKRMPFRRLMKQAIEKAMANRDVQGIRISMSGRLGGAEMSRQEELKKGRVPLQTLRADIDFAREEAYMPYGVIGVKVWVYRGDIFADQKPLAQ
jgi:small subunit ribosomal protein S3